MSHQHGAGEKWVTQQQALDELGVTRQTLWNWRKRHVICEARLHKRLPRVFNYNDLLEAETLSTRRNPVMRSVI